MADDEMFVQIGYRLWRCRICGEIIFSINRPSHCPYCGVEGEMNISTDLKLYDSLIADFKNNKISEDDRKHLKESIYDENYAVGYYSTLAKTDGLPKIRAIFKTLARHESEHLELLSDLLGEPEPDRDMALYSNIVESMIKNKGWHGAITAAITREVKANESYTSYALASKNSRLVQVWTEISKVEFRHSLLLRKQLDQIKW